MHPKVNESLTRRDFEKEIDYIDFNALQGALKKPYDIKKLEDSIEIVCINFAMLEASLQINLTNFEKSFKKFHEIIKNNSYNYNITDEYKNLQEELFVKFFTIKKQVLDLFCFYIGLSKALFCLVFYKISSGPLCKLIARRY